MKVTAEEIAPELHPSVIGRSRVRASLRLDFRRDSTGSSFLLFSEQEPPLRVVRAFTLDDGSALAHLHNVSGGLLGGDQLLLQVQIGPSANVQLTSTGATRIYRDPEGFSATTQVNKITVEKNGLLEYLPDQIIPFAAARFRQQTSIHLEEGAGLFWWEILAPGREARGELFAYEQVEMSTDVLALGRRIALESIRLTPGENAVSSLARLGPYRYCATFFICRVGLDPSVWRASEEYLRGVTGRLTQAGETLWGISTLMAHGLIVRCLARRGHGVLRGLQAIWRAAKLHLYGCDAIPPRKVN